MLMMLIQYIGRKRTCCKEKHIYLVVASKEIGLEVNADTTKYMVMSRDQRAEEVKIPRLIQSPLQGWKSTNMWEQP
jgi:hypothetical protein